METLRYADFAMAALVGALLAGLVFMRARAQRRRTRLAAARERSERLIAERLVGGDRVTSPAELGRLDRETLLDAGLATLLEVRGRERDRVAELLEEAGLADDEAAKLRGGRRAQRRHAADRLGLIAGARTREALRPALADPDPLVRLAAARGLAEAGDGDEVLRSASAIADAATEQHAGAVAELVLALGDRAPATLGAFYAASQSAEVRRIVIAVVGELRLGEHVDLLRDALAGDDELAARAARGLGTIGDIESTSALVDVVADPRRSWFVRAAATTALGQLGDPVAVAPLAAELAAGDWPRRRAAAEALARLGPSGEAALRAQLTEADTDAGRHAAAALDR